jgi:hypothetical protein
MCDCMSIISLITQIPLRADQGVSPPIQRKNCRGSLFQIITRLAVATLIVLPSLGGVVFSSAHVQTSPSLGFSDYSCELNAYPVSIPFEKPSSEVCIEEEDPAIVERRQSENYHRKLPCPPNIQKIVVFTSVAGGRGDVAASAKAVDLMRSICPLANVDWVLDCFGCAIHGSYDPRLFLNRNDPLKTHLRDWPSEGVDKSPVNLLLLGPIDPGWSIKYFEKGLGRKIAGPIVSFTEIADTPVWNGRDASLAMGLKARTGVFLDRSRIEAPLSRKYCCPSYLPQIQDDGLRKDILEAMNVTNDQSPDYDQYSFNSGYAHHEVSWAKFIDAVAIHERDKDVVIVLNQKGAFSSLSTQKFQNEIFTSDRLTFLKQKGYGTVILKGQESESVLLQEAENPQMERRLVVILRPSFVPIDMKRMQLASERLLATGDNSAVEAWSSRCKLYLYEDVANLGSKWKFLQQQVDFAKTISPNLAKLLALFGGDRRLPQPSLNMAFDKAKMDQLERLLEDPDLGSATIRFCNQIIKNYSFNEVLEGTVKRVAWQYYNSSKLADFAIDEPSANGARCKAHEKSGDE